MFKDMFFLVIWFIKRYNILWYRFGFDNELKLIIYVNVLGKFGCLIIEVIMV